MRMQFIATEATREMTRNRMIQAASLDDYLNSTDNDPKQRHEKEEAQYDNLKRRGEKVIHVFTKNDHMLLEDIENNVKVQDLFFNSIGWEPYDIRAIVRVDYAR